MVKPAKRGPVQRRTLTVSIYALSWVLLTLLSRAWLLAGLLLGVLRRRSFILLRLLCFAWFYLGLELIALVLVAWAFVARDRGALRRPCCTWISSVLKQELLFDPCIDIVGNQLPNYFVDRSGDHAH